MIEWYLAAINFILWIIVVLGAFTLAITILVSLFFDKVFDE